MEVTIEYKEEAAIEGPKTLWGKIRNVQKQTTSYNVYLYIVPSEEERAVILKYRVGELAFDDEPEYSPRKIDEARENLKAAAEEFDRKQLAVAPQKQLDKLTEGLEYWERELKHRKEATIGVKLEEFFDNPFLRHFDHPQDAQAFIDRLREITLPRVKAYIEEYASRSDRVSFSL